MKKKFFNNYSKLSTPEQVLIYYLGQTEAKPPNYELQTVASPIDKELEYLIETKQLSAIIDLLGVRPASVPKILRRLSRQNATSSGWEVAL